MVRVVFDPSTLAKSADVNSNFSGTWNGTFMDDNSISWRHLAITGAIIDYPGSTIPTGWLPCEGQSLLRSTYSALFAAIGTTYGSVDSTHFNIPDRRGRVAVGLDPSSGEFDALGETGGEKYHTLTTSEMPAHSHGVTDPGHAHGVYDPSHDHQSAREGQNVFTAGSTNTTYAAGGFQQITWGNTRTSYSHTGIGIYGATTGVSIQNAGSGSSHNNLQPYQVTNFIIKT